ncbi:MAG: hypothetical protein BRD52_06700 [Bacteroidetes bacterium SW_4_67_19]|nr:MAG: hypothetical protein BRD52_06700 [Bacteroidetes bacterium SW_4_67_19]
MHIARERRKRPQCRLFALFRPPRRIFEPSTVKNVPNLAKATARPSSAPSESPRLDEAERHEQKRLEALRRYDILDTPPEESFDRLTRLAAAHFDAPIALVTLVADERQWFKSCIGFDRRETNREVSFCHHALQSNGPLVVEDATEEVRFMDNPLVTGPTHIRFYAGAPLRTPDGYALGTLCVMDTQPRAFSDEDMTHLRDFAAAAMDALEQRRRAEAHRQAEQAQRASERKLRRIVENAQDVIYRIDAEGRWGFLSPSWKELTGYRPEESLGERFIEVLHPEDQSEALFDFEGRAEGPDRLLSREDRFVTKTGDVRWVRVRGRLITEEHGEVEGVIGTISDITDSRRMEAEREARQRAEELLEAKTSLLNNMSHELRTPLASILGFSEVLAAEGDEQQQEFAEIIGQNGKRLQRTLESVLHLAQIESNDETDLTLEPTDVADAVRTVAATYRPPAEDQDLSFEVRTPPEDEETRALLDREALEHLLDDLLSNAVKFTKEGGVTVSVDTGTSAVRLRVEDTGVGMSASFQSGTLFEEFTQESTGLDREYEGTGLGLAIARRLVEQMDGTIDVESSPGEGTTFTVRFPRLAPADTMDASPEAAPPRAKE